MRDEIYDRDIQSARGTLLNDFRLLGQALASSLKVLHRINFQAPWREKSSASNPC